MSVGGRSKPIGLYDLKLYIMVKDLNQKGRSLKRATNNVLTFIGMIS